MLNLFCLKIVLIFLMFVICTYSSSVKTETKNAQSDTNKNFMKVYEKLEYLSDEVDELKESKMSEMMRSIEEMDRKMNKMQENKTDQIAQLLKELVSHQKKSLNSEKSELSAGFSSECNALCLSKADSWANHTRAMLKDNLHNTDSLTPFTTDHSSGKKSPKTSGACMPDPCLHGGRCELNSTGSGYLCKECPYPTYGKRCEQFPCDDNRCFFHNDVYYELFDLGLTWDQGQRHCQRAGMTLAMLKDQETSDFLTARTRAIYGGGAIWAGLKFNVGEGQWQWVDGTPLGPYRGAKAVFGAQPPSGQLCCMMTINAGHVFCDPVACTRKPYPFCEKRYKNN